MMTVTAGILAGNSCIVKPPYRLPISTFEIVKIFYTIAKKSGFPPGVINMVVGSGSVVVREWMDNRNINGIVFYGSSHTGLKVGAEATANYKKTILELSGNDACLIWKDANLEDAVDNVMNARFTGSGQVCIAIKRLYVHKDVYGEVVDMILSQVRKLKVGLPSDVSSSQGPIGSIEEVHHLKDVIDDALKYGGRIICGGKQVDCQGHHDKLGLFFEPTIVVGVNHKMRIIREETFGPLLPIMKIDSLEEALSCINDSIYGLRASFWGKDNDVLQAFIKNVNTGGIVVNDSHYFSAIYTPDLGGVKASGITGSKYLVEQMCYCQYVHTCNL